MANAFDQYGYIATLANSIPELKKILNQAISGPNAPWTPDKFAQAVQNSAWWRNNSDQVKQNAILKATKPGEFAAQRSALTEKARTLAQGMGFQLTEGAHGTLAHIVNTAQALGWDDTTLQQHIGAFWRPPAGSNGTSGGLAGSLQQQIRQVRADYGLGGDAATENHQVGLIMQGKQTVDGYKAQVTAAAMSRYPGFSQQLKEGQTMTQIADPYIQTVAQTLEMAPTDVDLMDPTIQRALTNRDQHGNPVPLPLWQLQDQVRQDPRYDHTTQAVNGAYAMINQIGKDWGFSA